MSVDWSKLIPAAVTIVCTLAVFLTAKYAPEDLEAVTALVDELQLLLITILAAITVKSVAGSVASVAQARIVAEVQIAQAYAQADSGASVDKAG